MKIGVDARLMTERPRGMGQYANALLGGLNGQFIPLLPHGPAWASSQVPLSDTAVRKGWSFDPWWEQAVLPRLARRNGITHLLCPGNTGPTRRIPKTKIILVVHDLIFLESLAALPASRSAYQNAGRLYRRFVVPAAVRAADHIVTVSRHTQQEVCRRFNLDISRVRMIPNCVDDGWFVNSPMPDTERRPFILTVGGEAPSKNLTTLLKAWSMLSSTPHHGPLTLQVVGVKPEFHSHFMAEARALGIERSVCFSAPVSTSELRGLYRSAQAFVMPSLYEGFGIPVLEAMASGTPVICSNTTALPEVAGGHGWLFDPRQPDDMARQILQCLTAGPTRIEKAEMGLKHAQQYRREEVARQMTNFWMDIA